MNWLNKHLSFKTDLLVTLLNGLVVVGGVFILNGLIARIYGLNVLGEFLLVKRILSSAVGILLIGMSVGLPNYLSRDFDRSLGDNAFLLFCFITVPLTILFIAGILWFKITGFYHEYFWVYIILSLGISAQFIAYALFRGYMNMLGANVLQLLGTAIIPIFIFTLGLNLYDAMFFIGSTILAIMVFAYLSRNKGFNIHDINIAQSKIMIKYGLERIPSFASQFILLAGVPLIIAQTVNFESVAYFNSSLSLVRLSLLIVNPIGMVMLPRISNKIASGAKNDVKNILSLFIKAGIIFSVIGTVYCYINANLILKVWLGEVSEIGISILHIVILALPFYTFSGLARSPIDAVSERGYNSLIYGLAAVSMIIIIFVGKLYNLNMLTTALISFLFSHIVAGVGSFYYLQKLYKYSFLDFKLIRDIAASIIIIITISKTVAYTNMSIVAQFILTNMIYVIIGIMIFKFIKTGWIAELKTKIYAK